MNLIHDQICDLTASEFGLELIYPPRYSEAEKHGSRASFRILADSSQDLEKKRQRITAKLKEDTNNL